MFFSPGRGAAGADLMLIWCVDLAGWLDRNTLDDVVIRNPPNKAVESRMLCFLQ